VRNVTGVQTCALPIFRRGGQAMAGKGRRGAVRVEGRADQAHDRLDQAERARLAKSPRGHAGSGQVGGWPEDPREARLQGLRERRSEERRGGKGYMLMW